MKGARSGTQWTEADYAAHGYGRITLRLPRAVLELLAAKAKESGKSRAELVEVAVRLYEGSGEPVADRSTETPRGRKRAQRGSQGP